MMLALGGNSSSSGNRKAAQSDDEEEDEEEDLISVVNAPVLIIPFHDADILEPHNRVKVVLALPIGITLPTCNVSPNGLAVEVSYTFPTELLDSARIFGADANYNDPGMVAFRKMRNLMNDSTTVGKILLRMPFEVDQVPLSVCIPEPPQCTIVITLKAKETKATSFSLA